MTDASTTNTADAAAFDPLTATPRELMQKLLPVARAEYIRAWEFLADTSTPLERRRVARTRAAAIASDHELVVEFIRGRESQYTGDDLLNARHLASELERHVAALKRLATISVIGLQESTDLRPEALGCGKRYRDPAKHAEAVTATRAVSAQPTSKGRDQRDRGRDNERKGNDRGPKVPRDALGSSKHDSPLGDDLDPETRAKLEAMRAALEAGE